MKKDLALVKPLKSSFLSCEKDTETILKKLFIESRPHSDTLKRLLVINTKDCLDDLTNPKYIDKINSMSIKKLIDEQYVKLNKHIKRGEHEEIKSHILISFDNFVPSENPEFRNCTITIDVVSHPDYWDIGNYRQRPIKIAGYIDGILNNSKLSGIGTLNLLGASAVTLDENLSGYTLIYMATHGSDDLIEGSDI